MAAKRNASKKTVATCQLCLEPACAVEMSNRDPSFCRVEADSGVPSVSTASPTASGDSSLISIASSSGVGIGSDSFSVRVISSAAVVGVLTTSAALVSLV